MMVGTALISTTGPTATEECGKLATCYLAGDVDQACVLVNNAAALCFPRGRVRFWHPDKIATAQPLQGQAVIYVGAHVGAFSRMFAQLGRVLAPTVGARA